MARVIESETKEGLRYLLLPQGIFTERMAAIVVKRGANALFWQDENGKEVVFPQGTAHFIEHKLFRQKWGDAFQKLTQNGAAANAFTDADKTVYYFRCRKNFAENLRILLDFVQHPFFLEEEIAREREIILQEIAMYADDPEWVCYYQMLEGMYETHPIRNQIAGTAQSVREITAETLYRAHAAYYTTAEMTLICTGDLPMRELLRMMECVKRREGNLHPILPTEPVDIQEKYREKEMGLRQPLFQIGWKLPPEEEQSIQRRIAMGILTELLAGESSYFYRKAYEKEILDTPLGAGYFSGAGYAFAAFSGKGKYPEGTAELLCAEWERLRKKGIAAQDFARIRKKLLGGFLRQLDSVQGLCMGQIAWEMTRTAAPMVLRQMKEVRREAVEELLREAFALERMTLSVVR